MRGAVSLVGAGPGDPGLLTLKAKRLIEKADLIVYDYLANPAHLRHARPDAAKLCVGRGFRHKKISQEKINRLIVQAAQKGRQVVRLKGGDPYLFGRGGEEAFFLRSHGIPFQVVPGITSAVACATYAGIPLTHRDFSSAVTFLTGHKAEDRGLDSIAWPNIVSVARGGTLVIYMGFYNLQKIAERLIAYGMSPVTKVAVIEWGTLPRQKSCEGSLAVIALKVAQKKLKAPCVIVIGKVVSLRDQLGWFEKLPLFGKKIVITRTREQSVSLRERLEGLGGGGLACPPLETKPPADFSKMDRAIRRVSGFDWVVFSSVHGVHFFFERLRALKLDARVFQDCRVAAVGPQSGAALEKRGIRPDLIPLVFETKAIASALKKRLTNLKAKKILLVQAAIAPPDLEKNLKKQGALVERIAAYRTLLPKSVPAGLKNFILKEPIDAVTFTSASTVDHFIKIFGPRAVKILARQAAFVSIGPVTSGALKKWGLRAAAQARVFTVDGLIQALCACLRSKRKG